jgi:hypothetical protein
MAGAAQDSVWSNLKLANSRILDAFGQGVKDGWGSEPMGVSPEIQQALTRAGVFNDYSKSHTDFMKSVNEAWMRPAIGALSLGWRTVTRGPGSVIQGLTEAAQQAGEEQENTPGLGPGEPGSRIRQLSAYPFKLAAEVGQDVLGGAIPEIPELPHAAAGAEAAGELGEAEAAMSAVKARASGVIGEGEAGYYDAATLTPENAEARVSAAQDAGIAPVQPGPPPPDIHALARRIDPDTLGQYDALAAERDAARDEVARLSAEDREQRPEVQAARADLHDLIGLEPDVAARAGGFEERLQAVAASAPEDLLDKVATAYDRLDALLHEDTPELAQARQRLLQADVQMRDLAPQVSEAYRQAAEIVPEQPSASEAMIQAQGQALAAEEGKPGATEPGEGEGPRVPGHGVQVAPVAAAEGEAAQIAPPEVLGGETLGAPAHPAEQPQPETEAAATEGSGIKAPTARYGNLRAVEGTGETKVRGLSEGVEAKAIEDGLVQRFGDLPEYRALSMKDQAEAAADLIGKDPELAKAIAMGDKQPPKGLLPESVFVAVEKHALATGDVETLRDLGTRSRLTTTATTMGQRIRTLGERDQASPVGHIQEVQQAREAALLKRAGSDRDIEKIKADEAEEIRSEVRKAATKKVDAWQDFLSSIRCEG